MITDQPLCRHTLEAVAATFDQKEREAREILESGRVPASDVRAVRVSAELWRKLALNVRGMAA